MTYKLSGPGLSGIAAFCFPHPMTERSMKKSRHTFGIKMEKYITSDKIFHHIDRLNRWSNGELVRPVTFEIHPSNVCNHQCYYCVSQGFLDNHQMTGEELLKAIDKLAAMGLRGLIFSGGGEPLCNKETLSGVAYAKHQKVAVGFITNGVLIDPAAAKHLMANCDWVRVSLDSMRRDTYKKIRGTDQFGLAVQGIKNLLHTKPNSQCTVGIQMVVNDYNSGEITHFVNRAEQEFQYLDYVQIRPVEIGRETDPYSGQQMAIIQNQFHALENTKALISQKWEVIFGQREYGFTACHCYGLIGAVDAHGDLYTCCHTIKKSGLKYGNIFNDDIEKIFTGREFMAEKSIKTKLSVHCPIACRGSSINRRLEGLQSETEHKNFL